MMSSVIPARLEFQCGHAALVSLPRVKGESPAQRTDRIAREKSAAQARSCDFCPSMEVAEVVQAVVVVAAQPAPTPDAVPVPPVTRPVAPSVQHVASVAPVAQPVEPVVAHAETVVPVVAPMPPVAPVAARTEGAATITRRLGVRPKSEIPGVSSGRTPSIGWPRGAASGDAADFSAAPLGRPRRTSALTVQPAAPARTGRAVSYRFVVRFRTEAVLNATDIRDALRQAESLGATEVLALSRSA